MADQNNNALSVIDPITHSKIASIPLGSAPEHVFTDPALRKVYAYSETAGTLTVINGDTFQVETVMPLPSSRFPSGQPSVNPNTHQIYIPNSDRAAVLVLNGYNNTLLDAVTFIGSGVQGVTTNPASNLVYVSADDGRLAVFDGNSNRVYGDVTMPTTTGLSDIIADACNCRIYVLRADGVVVSINSKSNAVVDETTLPQGGYAMAADTSLGLLYVINSTRDHVDVINLCDMQPLGQLDLGTATNMLLTDIAVDETSHLVYVTDERNARTYVANGGLNKYLYTIQEATGTLPVSVASLACHPGCFDCCSN